MPNLRILHNNLVSSASSIVSSPVNASFPISNILNPRKGAIYRSTGTTASVTITWSSAITANCLILPITNLTSSATVRARMYNVSDVLLRDSGILTAVKNSDNNTGLGVNNFILGGSNCAVVYFLTTTAIAKIVIDIVDTGNPAGFLEISSILTGEYWSPTYNTGFGIAVGYEDASIQERTESGDLLTETNYIYKTLSFDLGYMNSTDRNIMLDIIRRVGKRGSVFVSIFPEDTEAGKEATYQIYGKFKDLATITHPVFSMYATSIEIEEV